MGYYELKHIKTKTQAFGDHRGPLYSSVLGLQMSSSTSKQKPRAAVASDVYNMTGGVGSWLYMAPEVVRKLGQSMKVLAISA